MGMQVGKQTARLLRNVAIFACMSACAASGFCVWSQRRLRIVAAQNSENEKRLSILQDEFDMELGEAIKLDQLADSVNPDFELFEDDAIRCVKMLCPVSHRSDIAIEVISNGCAITINPQLSFASSA